MSYIRWFDNSVESSINSGWLNGKEFAAGGPNKRLKAIFRVWDKVSKCPENPFSEMPTVTFFAPRLTTAGEVKRTQPTGVVVYLAPTLEFDTQPYVDRVVAHELAHVALGHYRLDNPQVEEYAEKHEDRPSEKAADELAATWGFPPQKRHKGALSEILDLWARR